MKSCFLFQGDLQCTVMLLLCPINKLSRQCTAKPLIWIFEVGVKKKYVRVILKFHEKYLECLELKACLPFLRWFLTISFLDENDIVRLKTSPLMPCDIWSCCCSVKETIQIVQPFFRALSTCSLQALHENLLRCQRFGISKNSKERIGFVFVRAYYFNRTI